MNKKRHKYTLGIDLGDRECHFAVVSGIGGEQDIEVVETAIVPTTAEGVIDWFTGRAPMRVVIEVGTHARWIAMLLEARGHEVLVCNPRKLSEISDNPRKCDLVDAETLARIGHTDTARLTLLVDFTDRDVISLALVRAHEQAVRVRKNLINHVRGVVKSYGGRIDGCGGRRFHCYRHQIPPDLAPILDPMVDLIEALTKQIRAYERDMEKVLAQAYPQENAVLRQLRGVGPKTALYFIAIVGDPRRFENGRKFAGYLGFGQKRHQSGDKDPHLSISKAGAPLLRALLVGTAQKLLDPRAPDSALRDWAVRRRDKQTQIQKNRIKVGLARKIAVLMLHLLKTGQKFRPYPNGGEPDRDAELVMVREAIA